jgi:hypothetical protein
LGGGDHLLRVNPVSLYCIGGHECGGNGEWQHVHAHGVASLALTRINLINRLAPGIVDNKPRLGIIFI